MLCKSRWLPPALLISCALLGPAFATEPADEFTPQNGFAGASEGHGWLKLFLGKPRAFEVKSRGSQQPDGTFRLDQTVTFEGEPPKERFWILIATRPHRYSATLSDAAGPVTGTSSGRHLSLQYRVKGPLVMHQELEWMPDGKTIDNVGVIRMFGIPVGRLQETITRDIPGVGSATVGDLRK